VWQAYFNRALGRRDVAVRLRQRSLTILERPELADQDTQAERALLTQHMGRAVFLSDYEQARQFLEESLALYRGLDDPWRTAAGLHSLGTAALFRGAYADARAAMEESLEISRSLGDQEGIAWSMADLTFVAIHQGRFDEAGRLARDARAITQALGDREGIGFGLLAWGASLEHMGKFAEAHAVRQECLRVFTDLGRRGWIILAQSAMSSVSLHLGQYGDAGAHADAALALARETGLQLRVGEALVQLGRVDVVGEAYDEAWNRLQEALALYREIGASADVGWSHAILAHATRGLAQPAQMRQHLRQALRAAKETGDVLLGLSVMPAAALWLADRGDAEGAVEVYTLASRCGFVAQSRWFHDVAGRHIDAVAASLPQDVVAAVEKRGRAEDVEATTEGLLEELEDG
jgi:tetratricopeptide (TPR) repeat protein